MWSKFLTTNKNESMSDTVKFNDIESKIITFHNQNVIIDSDVADLYGVKTKEINQAVRNNPEKFPYGYVLDITKVEKEEVVKNFDHLVKLKFSPVLPKAFTEKGLYMLATILKSKKATETTIGIIETYAKIKELSRTVVEISEVPEEQKKKSLMQKGGEIFSEIFEDDLNLSETETTIEFNLAVLKFKHTIKRKGGSDIVSDEEPIYIKITK